MISFFNVYAHETGYVKNGLIVFDFGMFEIFFFFWHVQKRPKSRYFAVYINIVVVVYIIMNSGPVSIDWYVSNVYMRDSKRWQNFAEHEIQQMNFGWVEQIHFKYASFELKLRATTTTATSSATIV